MIEFKENAWREGRTEGRTDGRTNRPYFIGPFQLPPGGSKKNELKQQVTASLAYYVGLLRYDFNKNVQLFFLFSHKQILTYSLYFQKLHASQTHRRGV